MTFRNGLKRGQGPAIIQLNGDFICFDVILLLDYKYIKIILNDINSFLLNVILDAFKEAELIAEGLVKYSRWDLTHRIAVEKLGNLKGILIDLFILIIVIYDCPLNLFSAEIKIKLWRYCYDSHFQFRLSFKHFNHPHCRELAIRYHYDVNLVYLIIEIGFFFYFL